MNNSNTIFIIIASLMPSLLFAYECDTGELRRVPPKEMTSVSSKKYSDDYNHLYAQQAKSIENLKLKIPAGRGPREFYFSTRPGQSDLQQLGKLRSDFQYDSVAQYLFDDEYFNTLKEHYTTLYRQGPKTFYLNRGRLVAVLEQKSQNEFLLTRLNRSCQPFEIVSFTSLNPEIDSNIRYKVTPALCKVATAQSRLPATQTFVSHLSYASDLADRGTQRGIQRDCDLLKKSPASPPSAPPNKTMAFGNSRL